MTEQAAGGSSLSRMKESIHDSAGEIVFGMSDGVVSIFGLVLGVAAGAQSGEVVFLAGATGAIAASVAMMAGLYLDLESVSDEARVEAERRETEIRSDPFGAVDKLMGVLQGTGLSTKSLNAIRDDMQADPLAIRRIETAISYGRSRRPGRSPRSCMLRGWGSRTSLQGSYRSSRLHSSRLSRPGLSVSREPQPS